jgi:2,4-dienoyl-CoA reductase-like NADH-dependent reductase (Old Yellow Enzyme family)
MLKKLTEAIHSFGGVISAQLSHAGLNSSLNRLGPSDYEGVVRSNLIKGRELSSEEIWEIVYAFGDGAERAVEAGFDMVQIHGAHGWLISEFLSRFFNRRNDEWGGDLDRRMKILFEVYDEIRKRIGWNIPLSLKLNCDDFIPNSFTVDDSCV